MDTPDILIRLTRTAGRSKRKGLLRARESLIKYVLFGCALFSVLTTVAIIFVLANETLSFFRVNTSAVQAQPTPITAVLKTDGTPTETTFLSNWHLKENLDANASYAPKVASGDFLAVQDNQEQTILIPTTEILKATGGNTNQANQPAVVTNAFETLQKQAEAGTAPAITGWIESGPRTREVSPVEFVTDTQWSPLLGEEKRFGIWPLITGTLLITLIAALFALPVGLVTAIYLSEYAPTRVRSFVKPILEILAGIPTVVYGFFALTVITPGLNWLGSFYNALVTGDLVFDTYNAMAAGLAVGIMILPIVSSLAEDAIRAVPRSLRDGAYALGATRFDVSMRVVVPAALSGIMAAFLLAITRAVGETMIVALAAGGLAQMAYDPTGPAQTMTAYMVQIFLGDAPATGVEYKSSYAVAAVLFLMTLVLTVTGNIILRRFREEYE